MLCWCTFLGGSSNIVTTIFAYEGGQYCNYGLMSLHSPVNIQHAWPKIVDTPMTVISRIAFIYDAG